VRASGVLADESEPWRICVDLDGADIVSSYARRKTIDLLLAQNEESLCCERWNCGGAPLETLPTVMGASRTI